MGFKKLGGERKDVTVETLGRLKAQSDIANVRLGFLSSRYCVRITTVSLQTRFRPFSLPQVSEVCTKNR